MRFGQPVLLSLLVVAASLLAGCGGGESSSYRALASCDVPQATSELAERLDEYGPTPRVVVGTNKGNFTLELYVSKVPITAGNFLDLASDGFYDGVKFHRVIGPEKSPPSGFMIQGGDPNSKNDGAKSTWGQGGPGYEIPDEFHPDLMHEGEGILSMANSGPNTGGSQFFVTLASTHHLDYKHAVFGKVAEGMSVVRAIGNVATDDRDRPVSAVVIEAMTVEKDATAVEPAAVSPALRAFQPTVEAAPGRTANFLLFVQAAAQPIPEATLALAESAEVSVRDATTIESCFQQFALPAGQRFAVLGAFDVPSSASPGDEFSVPIRLGGGQAVDTTVTVRAAQQPEGDAVGEGDTVELNYVGFTIYGQVFDTSRLAVADDESVPKFPPVFQKRQPGQYQPFEFEVDGTGTIDGFSDAARGLKTGEEGVYRIPAEDAYPASVARQQSSTSYLAARQLIFDVEVVEIS